MKTINKLLLWLVLLGSPVVVGAQAQLTHTWPQYTLKGEPLNPDSSGGRGGIDIQDYTTNGVAEVTRIQSAYMPYMFPNTPEGNVQNLYIRIGVIVPDKFLHIWYPSIPIQCDSISLKMGYIEDSVLATTDTPIIWVPFLRNLSTVFSAPSIMLYPLDSYGSRGAWLKIPLNAGTFIFRHNQNFALEFTGRTKSDSGRAILYCSSFPVQTMKSGHRVYNWRFRSGSAHYDSSRSGYIDGVLAIGMDITPLGLSALSKLRGVGLFPNPAPEGRFHISLDARQPMKEVRITVSDLTGRPVLSKQYTNPGKSFFEEMNLGATARGIYFVRIVADGEVVTRRLSVE